jgi:hypothetical protein
VKSQVTSTRFDRVQRWRHEVFSNIWTHGTERNNKHFTRHQLKSSSLFDQVSNNLSRFHLLTKHRQLFFPVFRLRRTGMCRQDCAPHSQAAQFKLTASGGCHSKRKRIPRETKTHRPRWQQPGGASTDAANQRQQCPPAFPVGSFRYLLIV